jgi:RNA-directed DNA polymerase
MIMSSAIRTPAPSQLFARIISWENLLAACFNALRGKRGRETTARFEYQLADRLLELQDELQSQRYEPGPYRSFYIHEPKQRLISAAPFRDRVVHHALCNVIEPVFERRFIYDSYANRRGKGTHRAVDRLQAFARHYRYVLRLDIVKHFPSIDHAILRGILARAIQAADVLWLVDKILDSGAGVLDGECSEVLFSGDDVRSGPRPRGLPIGNLTSQFWSNCYLDPFDHFVKRELCCPAYLRYCDDFALFSDSKQTLWRWKAAIVERLAGLRLTVHNTAQVTPVRAGVPWLGFIVYPTHRRLKGRTIKHFRRRLKDRWQAYCAGDIGFAEFDATVQGWINHVCYADTWGLRRHVLGSALGNPGDTQVGAGL